MAPTRELSVEAMARIIKHGNSTGREVVKGKDTSQPRETSKLRDKITHHASASCPKTEKRR